MFNFYIFIVFGFIWCNLTDYLIHFGACRLAKKTNKPICSCWDCKRPCELWKFY